MDGQEVDHAGSRRGRGRTQLGHMTHIAAGHAVVDCRLTSSGDVTALMR